MSVPDTPEFRKELNEACEKQYRGFLYGGDYVKAHSKDSIAEKMEEIQKQRKELENSSEEFRRHAERVRHEARIVSNSHMREITDNLRRRSGSSGLICPMCGEGDHGNRMNGKPVCFMNAKHGGLGPIPLMTPEKAKDWKHPQKPMKVKSYTFNEVEEVTKARPK